MDDQDMSVRTPNSRPSSALKRSIIIQAAIELFADRGFDGVSLRDIAKHANVPLSTLVHHFSDKKVIYGLAVTRVIETAAAYFLEATELEGPIEARLRYALQRNISQLMTNSAELRLIGRALVDQHVRPDIEESPVVFAIRNRVMAFFTEVSEHTGKKLEWFELSELYGGAIYGAVRFRPLHASFQGDGRRADVDFSQMLIEFFLAGIGMSPVRN